MFFGTDWRYSCPQIAWAKYSYPVGYSIKKGIQKPGFKLNNCLLGYLIF